MGPKVMRNQVLITFGDRQYHLGCHNHPLKLEIPRKDKSSILMTMLSFIWLLKCCSIFLKMYIERIFIFRTNHTTLLFLTMVILQRLDVMRYAWNLENISTLPSPWITCLWPIQSILALLWGADVVAGSKKRKKKVPR